MFFPVLLLKLLITFFPTWVLQNEEMQSEQDRICFFCTIKNLKLLNLPEGKRECPWFQFLRLQKQRTTRQHVSGDIAKVSSLGITCRSWQKICKLPAIGKICQIFILKLSIVIYLTNQTLKQELVLWNGSINRMS